MNGKIDFRGIRVLSLDDNMLDTRVLEELLEGTGVILDATASAEEALKKLSREEYDVVMIDHMMPGVDGITLLKLLRDKHVCDGVPVIAVTGNTITSAKENYLQAGFSGYVSKPIDKNTLLETLAISLGFCRAAEDKPQKSSVLVVDDNRMNLLVAQKILADDYSVSIVTSGKAALEFLQYNNVDLILLDLRMPEMDGFQFMEHIKDQERLKSIPIICLTADDETESEVKCFELGAVDFIAKPFIAEVMRHRISRTLELDRLREDLQNEVNKQTHSLKKYSEKMSRLTRQVFRTLAGTIDAKDKYTNGHSLRVAEYSRMIAKRLNMSQQEQEDIYYIGLLHDIGKIGVPDDIINKTSRLTDEEYAVIKTHPSIGAEILDKMSEIPDISVGAKYHHERYDGRGYPEGLCGENIPLVARIIGVADAYDAMTSNRSYRDVLAQDYVRGEIEKGKGTQFDPVFAEIMLRIIDSDKDYVLREHK
ncbi:MAG: response regulator [Oscillospiraceae bacterium]|nr:response regulator [Oscillospiraceae bacterium]